MRLEIPHYRFNLRAPEFQKTDDEFMIWFLEGVLEKYPTYVDALVYLGNLYTAVGMYENGLKADLKLVKLMPDDPLAYYNLACSYSMLERVNESLESLEKAIDRGYNDLKHLVNDRDLENLRGEERYKALINKLKKSSQKIV